MKLYEVLASDLEASIRQGVLRPGDKLPSVRHTSTARGVSPSTVFQAYYLLEARGLVKARERAGYFVTKGAQVAPPEPRLLLEPQREAVQLEISELVFAILEETHASDDVGFASAFPSPHLFPLPRLTQALASSARLLRPKQTLEYLTPGYGELRRQIATRYLAEGLSVAADEIVITNGALEALNLCLSVLTEPGDSVVIECPSFYGALQALEARGVQAIQVPTHPCEGVDLAALEAAITRHRPRACWLMTTFQNPLGSLMPEEKKKALVDLLTRHGVPLIEDDVYADLYLTPKRPMPAKAFDAQGLVLHCSSFSKSLAPGFRVGWVVPGRFARKVARAKLALNLSTSLPAQFALAEYLAHAGYDKHLRQLRKVFRDSQAAMARAILRYFPDGTAATRPLGGYFLWVELPEGYDALELLSSARPLGLCVAPGPMFSPDRSFRNCFRLNYGCKWSPMHERGMQVLGKLLIEQQPRISQRSGIRLAAAM